MAVDTLVVSSSPKNSTTVRANIRPLQWLARVSPALAGRAAARMFFTTFRPPVRPEEAALLDHAERLAIPFGKRKLAAWELGEGPTVLLTHGWNGRAAQLAPLAGALATAGFRAVVFDHPAHGLSEGTTTTIPEMTHALSEVDGWLGGVHAVVGHSMGGVLATLAMARTIEPKRAVFLSAPVEPMSWPTAFARKLGLPTSVDAAMLAAIEARAGVTIDRIDPKPHAAAMTTPLLVVHDRADREVPFSAAETLAKTWPGAELVATEGLGHYRILKDPVVGERVLQFLAPLVRG